MLGSGGEHREVEEGTACSEEEVLCYDQGRELGSEEREDQAEGHEEHAEEAEGSCAAEGEVGEDRVDKDGVEPREARAEGADEGDERVGRACGGGEGEEGSGGGGVVRLEDSVGLVYPDRDADCEERGVQDEGLAVAGYGTERVGLSVGIVGRASWGLWVIVARGDGGGETRYWDS